MQLHLPAKKPRKPLSRSEADIAGAGLHGNREISCLRPTTVPHPPGGQPEGPGGRVFDPRTRIPAGSPLGASRTQGPSYSVGRKIDPGAPKLFPRRVETPAPRPPLRLPRVERGPLKKCAPGAPPFLQFAVPAYEPERPSPRSITRPSSEGLATRVFAAA